MSQAPPPPSGSDPTLHDRVAPLIEPYVIDALDPAEAALVDQHLEEGCEGCEEEVGILRRVAQALPLASRLVTPAADLKRRVFDAALGEGSPSATMTRRATPGPPLVLRPWARTRWSAVAATLVLAVGGLLAWAVVLQTQVDDLRDDNASLVSSVAQMDSDTAEATSGSRMAAALLSLSAPGSQAVEFRGTAQVPAATARILWDPDKEIFILVAGGLHPTADHSAYVVWVETPDGWQPLAKFYIDESGMGVVDGRLDRISLSLADASTMTISYEPDPATKVPTDSPVLVFNR